MLRHTSLLPLCLVSVLAMGSAGVLAQSDAEADRAAAVEEALAAFAELSAQSDAATEEADAQARADAVAEARAAFEALAAASLAEAAAEAEESAAAERAAALADARAAFEALAAQSLARAVEEADTQASAGRAAALSEARSGFEALAEASLADAIETAEASAMAEARAGFEALAGASLARAIAEVEEQAAASARDAAIAEAQAAFEAVAAESAARAEAEAAGRAALEDCVTIAGVPSAEVPLSEEAQRASFAALRDALDACRAAAEALPDEGAPFFHLATAAQASGRHRRAIPLYEQAAENGVAAALTRLGDYHNFGIRPVREDVDQAVELYRQATDAGDVAGTATLAFMYRLGRGVERDPAEMVRLMQQAADAGYPFAQFNLGQTFLTGEGVPGRRDEALGIPDARRAVPLLAAAARSGNLEAAENLVELYTSGGAGLEPSPFLRYRWTNFIAETTGEGDAIAARAFLLEQGIGRGRNPQLAAEEYIRALETLDVSIETMRGPGAPRWDGETASAFQTILADRGFYTLLIDGDVGPGTIQAARDLQASVEN